MKYQPMFKATLSAFLLVVLAAPLVSATTISVRGHSNYGLGGPGEQLASQSFTLPDGTVISGLTECPTAGPDANGQCDLMFIYTIDSLGSSGSNLAIDFSGLSNFDFNGSATFSPFNTATTGILGIDDAGATPMSSLPGINATLLALNGTSIDATGGLGNVNFSITNPFVGLSFFFIDTANTQICPLDETGFPDCTAPNLSLAAVPAPTSTSTVTPEPGSGLLVLTGLFAGALLLKRAR